MESEINNALKILKVGGIILYPTDTIWGIGCDATNKNAVSDVFKLKKRAESKALISLVANKKQLRTLTNKIPAEAENCKPTTIIYRNINSLAENLIADDGTIAIRIVKDNFCRQLIKRFKKPIVSTSANISGENTPIHFSEISDEIKKNVDYIVNLRQNEIMKNPSNILLIEKNGDVKKIR